jgi:hypothetical protein
MTTPERYKLKFRNKLPQTLKQVCSEIGIFSRTYCTSISSVILRGMRNGWLCGVYEALSYNVRSIKRL